MYVLIYKVRTRDMEQIVNFFQINSTELYERGEKYRLHTFTAYNLNILNLRK